jgi:hypothetical protein
MIYFLIATSSCKHNLSPMHKVTSPITTTIGIQPCSKCGTALQIFSNYKTLGFEKSSGGIIICRQSMNKLCIFKRTLFSLN